MFQSIVDRGKFVITIFLNFKKAFAPVVHNILFAKFEFDKCPASCVSERKQMYNFNKHITTDQINSGADTSPVP